MMQLPIEDGLAQVAFRLCRMMVARKVLWDEDLGFEVAQIARALATTPAVVTEILRILDVEGWVVFDQDAETARLTALGEAATLGRLSSAVSVQDRDALDAGPTVVAPAQETLGR